jgi:hypothetical protein
MANKEMEKIENLNAIISMALTSYYAAARSRDDLLDTACGAPWLPKAQEYISHAAIIQRICNGLCQELKDLHELKEKIEKQADKELKIIIEHIESAGNNSQTGKDAPEERP